MLKSNFLDEIGLFDGKMGITVFFYHYARHTGSDVYADYAGDLLDDVWGHLHNRLPDTFGSGLTGIAWGIEYLIQNKFVSGNSNEICEDMDAHIMHIDPRRMTPQFIEKELEGFLHYVLIRISSSIKQQNGLPFDEMYRLPVVASNGFGVRNMFQDGVNAKIAETGNRKKKAFENNLTTAILELLSSETLYKQLSNGSRQTYESCYTSRKMKECYNELLETFLEKRG